MNKKGTYFNPLSFFYKSPPLESVASNLIVNYSKMTAISENFAIILILAPPVARQTTQYALCLRI